MNFYLNSHQFYCGIDLHANNMYACVVDHAGNKQLHQNFKTIEPDKFLNSIEPFRKDLIVRL